MFKIGVGWIGWTEDVTLDTSMYGIQMAYEGRMEMLRAIFGGGEAAHEKPEESARPMTPELFDSLFL